MIEDNEHFYFVMELCEGGDLQHYLQDCKTSCISESSAASLIRQMCCAMRYMHGRLMAHSDFAARNVLLFESPSDSALGNFTAKLAEAHLCRLLSSQVRYPKGLCHCFAIYLGLGVSGTKAPRLT